MRTQAPCLCVSFGRQANHWTCFTCEEMANPTLVITVQPHAPRDRWCGFRWALQPLLAADPICISEDFAFEKSAAVEGELARAECGIGSSNHDAGSPALECTATADFGCSASILDWSKWIWTWTSHTP